ncbi:MAG: VWA-like domain-containing protein [Acinetobacter sp.]
MTHILIRPDNAFYASLALGAETYWSNDIPTAATNGKGLVFNPKWFTALNKEERIGLILHELMHMVYHHTIRIGNRDPDLWNVAGDHVINTELTKSGYTLPKGGCCDMRFQNMETEEVYNILWDEEQQQPGKHKNNMPDLIAPGDDGSDSEGQSTGDQGIEGEGKSNIPTPSKEEIEQHVKEQLVQAVQSAQLKGQTGSIPGNIVRDLQNLLQPKLPWKQILRKFLFSMNKTDYSWTKPNRRYIHQGIILPSLHGESLGQIDFAIDTSGSVSVADFNRFISEIAYVFKQFKPDGVGIYQFDHILQATDKVATLSDFMKLKFKGGGGTNIEPVLEHYKTQSKGKALIVLTDGYFHHTAEMNPNKPVIWLIYDNPNWQPPFGKAVYFDN